MPRKSHVRSADQDDTMTQTPKLRVVTLDKLREGQQLAQDACDRSGRLLVPAGVAVTGKHIQTLKAWGVTEVAVRADPLGVEGDAEKAVRTELLPLPQLEGLLAERFRHAPLDHPFMRELYEQARERASDQIKAQFKNA